MKVNISGAVACGVAIVVASTLIGGCKAKVEERPAGDTTSVSARTDTMATTPTTSTSDTTAMSAPAMTDANIFAKLDESNSLEVAEGKIGEQKGKSADVKAFAKMLVDDHGKMKKAGSDLAKSLNITPAPPAGDTSAQEMEHASQMLNGASAASFDSLFIAHEIDGHQKTLAALNMMQGMAKNDSLKMLITNAIPTVQHHLDQATSIQGKLASGGKTASTGSMGKMSDTGMTASNGKMKGKK